MKTLYLDCGMGAAGDMLAAALVELLPEPDKFIRELNALGLPGVQVIKEAAVKCGITGTHLSVTIDGAEEESHDHGHGHSHGHYHSVERDDKRGHKHSDECSDEHGCKHNDEHGCKRNDERDDERSDEHDHRHHHAHSSLHDIEHIVRGHLSIPARVQEDVVAVYGLIADAESTAHGVPVEEIHFHEVGTMDAIVDITAVCLLLHQLAPDEIVVSPIHVGSGQVWCAHGVLPVPAPATAHILKDVPIYGGRIKGELCTPTGAALLKYFATRFGDMPVMKTHAIGYGMGKKDFEAANCVRALLGEAEDSTDTVLELSCNVDDMTAEQIGFATECLLAEGALDVYTIPIGMKKSRPGTLIRVMCQEREKEKMVGLIFKHTTTIGVRETQTRRYVLDRRLETVETPDGVVHRKQASGYGVSRSKYEYEDIAAIARRKGTSLAEVIAQLSK